MGDIQVAWGSARVPPCPFQADCCLGLALGPCAHWVAPAPGS